MRNLNKLILPAMIVALFAATSVAAAPNANANEAATNNANARRAEAAEKLTATKLKVCQNRESGIQKRSQQLNKMAQNMLTKFDRIATKVETYYTSTSVPAGKTVSNYDALVADIASKKVTVQSKLDKAETDYGAFECTSDDPKGQLTQYRTDMREVKQALKDYRTSIKNLIVAVRSANSTTDQSED